MKRCRFWGRDVELQGSPLTLLIFKKEFGCDLAAHLSSSYKKEVLDIEDFLKIAWAMAKTCNEGTEQYEKWLAQFNSRFFTLSEIPIEVISSAINAELFCGGSTFEKFKRIIAGFLERMAKRFSA